MILRILYFGVLRRTLKESFSRVINLRIVSILFTIFLGVDSVSLCGLFPGIVNRSQLLFLNNSFSIEGLFCI